MSDTEDPTPQDDTPRVLRPGDPYPVPPEGSLGLLALGARGLDAWREVRSTAGLEPSWVVRSGDEEAGKPVAVEEERDEWDVDLDWGDTADEEEDGDE